MATGSLNNAINLIETRSLRKIKKINVPRTGKFINYNDNFLNNTYTLLLHLAQYYLFTLGRIAISKDGKYLATTTSLSLVKLFNMQ